MRLHKFKIYVGSPFFYIATYKKKGIISIFVDYYCQLIVPAKQIPKYIRNFGEILGYDLIGL
jgi:hypothetical protein